MMTESKDLEVNKEIEDIVADVALKETPPFDTDSPKYLLWQQQKKMNDCKKKTSMRWHPLMVRWCLSIYLRSPGKISIFK